MKKIRVILSIVMAAGLVALSGCGAKSEATSSAAADASAKAIGADLASKISYDDEMTELDIDTAMMLMNLSDVNIVESVVYESTGATAEEIVVLKCGSSDDAKKASDAFKARVADQKESFVDYVPEEIPKLDAAVIATAGDFAILSVSGDAATAKDIISGYLK